MEIMLIVSIASLLAAIAAAIVAIENLGHKNNKALLSFIMAIALLFVFIYSAITVENQLNEQAQVACKVVGGQIITINNRLQCVK